MDIEKYNMVNQNNCKKPNYILDDKEIYFEIYVSPDKEVCIVGSFDNNYIGWASIITLGETERIGSIFNYILKLKPVMVSNFYYALGIRYEEVRKWHKFRIIKKLFKGEVRYYSQASHAYLRDNEIELANYMAKEIGRFYCTELSKCKYRSMDNHYFKILESYKKLLTQKESNEYYYEMKPLISILETESYLKLSPNEEIRSLYLDCMEACSYLYNSYMSSVR